MKTAFHNLVTWDKGQGDASVLLGKTKPNQNHKTQKKNTISLQKHSLGPEVTRALWQKGLSMCLLFGAGVSTSST